MKMNELELIIMYPFGIISCVILVYIGFKRPEMFWDVVIIINIINVLLLIAFHVI